MTKAKLIVLNGFAAAGKTTIAKKYIAEHPLSLALEADAIVDNIGDWIHHEDEVRRLTFDLSKAMLRVYLVAGHDVVLPYLVTNADEVEAFESIASECSADYYEFVLYSNRDDAIGRLLKRGKWGETTSPPLTRDDMPQIEALLDKMEAALVGRPASIKIELNDDTPDETYYKLMQYIGV